MHPVIRDLLILVKRTPHPARPILAALLARDADRYMPGEIAGFVAGVLGAQRQPDPVLDAVQAIACRADATTTAEAWRTLRQAPRPTARAAVRGLRVFRDAVRIVARHAAARRQAH